MQLSFSYTSDDVLSYIQKFGCSISIATSIIVTFLSLFFKHYKDYTKCKILYLSLSNCVLCLSFLVLGSLCTMQALFINTLQLMQYAFSSVIAYCTLNHVIHKKHLYKYKHIYSFIFFIPEVVIPCALSVYVYLTSSIGKTGDYCWLDLENIYKYVFMKKLTLNLFCFICMLLVLNVFFIVKIYVVMNKNEHSNKELYIHLTWYPLLMVISGVPFILYRMHFITNKLQGNIFLKFCMTISENFAGAAINVFYMVSPWVRQSLVDSCYSLSAKSGMYSVYGLDEDYDYPLGYEEKYYEEDEFASNSLSDNNSKE